MTQLYILRNIFLKNDIFKRILVELNLIKYIFFTIVVTNKPRKSSCVWPYSWQLSTLQGKHFLFY